MQLSDTMDPKEPENSYTSLLSVEIKEEWPDTDEATGIESDLPDDDSDDVICVDFDKTMQYLAGNMQLYLFEQRKFSVFSHY